MSRATGEPPGDQRSVAEPVFWAQSTADVLGFVPVPLPVLAALALITAGYVLVTELAKVWFYRRRVNVPHSRAQAPAP